MLLRSSMLISPETSIGKHLKIYLQLYTQGYVWKTKSHHHTNSICTAFTHYCTSILILSPKITPSGNLIITIVPRSWKWQFPSGLRDSRLIWISGVIMYFLPQKNVFHFSLLWKEILATKSQRREKTRRTVDLGNHLVVALGLARGIYKMKESEGTITFKSPLEKKKTSPNVFYCRCYLLKFYKAD